MNAINGALYPRPAYNQGGTGTSGSQVFTGTALTVTSTAAVQISVPQNAGGAEYLYDLATLDIQGSNCYVTFDGTTPSSSAAHIMYVGEKADWNRATVKAAKFVATTTTNALVYCSFFQI